MSEGAKIICFPTPDEKITCHVRFPNTSETLAEQDDVAIGFANVASAMQRVAERFDDLALLFEECPEAVYMTGTHFDHGTQVFVFQLPRRFQSRLLKMGFESFEVDVGAVPVK